MKSNNRERPDADLIDYDSPAWTEGHRIGSLGETPESERLRFDPSYAAGFDTGSGERMTDDPSNYHLHPENFTIGANGKRQWRPKNFDQLYALHGSETDIPDQKS